MVRLGGGGEEGEEGEEGWWGDGGGVGRGGGRGGHAGVGPGLRVVHIVGVGEEGRFVYWRGRRLKDVVEKGCSQK